MGSPRVRACAQAAAVDEAADIGGDYAAAGLSFCYWLRQIGVWGNRFDRAAPKGRIAHEGRNVHICSPGPALLRAALQR